MKTVKYTLSVLLILGGIGFITQNSAMAGICLIILGVVLFPNISDKLKENSNLWLKKGIRYSAYILLFILSVGFSNNLDNSVNTPTANANYNLYINEVDSKVNSFTEKNKKSRLKSIEKLQSTKTYDILVNQKIISSDYLPVITLINNGLRNIAIGKDNVEVFSFDESLINIVKNSNNGRDKFNFALNASVLGTPNKGGYTKELIQVFENYRKKFGLYGVPSKAYSVNGSESENIKEPYNSTSIFYHIQPDNEILNSIYKANTKGAGRWFKNVKGSTYTHKHLATKQGYLDYAKKVNPESPYILKVDIELSSISLYNQYEANEVSADEKFKGKKLAVSGVIGEIGKDVLDNPYLSLDIDFLKNVNCYFDDKNNKVISRLSKGQRVTIIGVCRGKILLDVVLKDCEVWDN